MEPTVQIKIEGQTDKLAPIFVDALLALLSELNNSRHVGMFARMELYSDGSGWLLDGTNNIIGEFNDIGDAVTTIRLIINGGRRIGE